VQEEERESVLMLHLLDGEPQGPRVLEITHTNSKAIAVPRTAYERISKARSEFGRPGAYILVYDPIGGGPLSERIYIGEADVARERMNTHVRAADDDWNWFVLFTSRDGRMNKVHAEYIESRLVALARQSGRAVLENKNEPQEPTLDPADRATARRFLADVLMYCPILGIAAFSAPLSPSLGTTPQSAKSGVPASPTPQPTIPATALVYHLRALPEAKGYNSEKGFVVLSGTPLRDDVAPSVETSYGGLANLRNELEARGVLSKVGGTRHFNRDYVFDSPSQAAIFVLGYSISGRTAWVAGDGRTLNEVESGGLTESP
jgi:hypothetical protein